MHAARIIEHPEPAMDRLHSDLQAMIKAEDKRRSPRAQVFARIWELTHNRPLPENYELMARAAIPYLNEPWYC